MSKQALKYDKKTPREHILLRPDTYIGNIELTKEKLWVYNDETNIIEKREVNFSPGFLKIFDEILVNAADASQNDKTCDTIKVEYNRDEGYISVWNNGENGIPIEEHPEHKIYIPSMIFGELLTGSNFDDNQERTTGGRNGLGSKCTNIFSTKFIVELVDSHRGKKFIQEWTDNMLNTTKPKITSSKVKSYIKITFYPDLQRFGLSDLNNDHYNLFYRRTIDLAGICNNKLKLHFNDKKIDVTNFKSYISLYYKEEDVFFDNSNERWTVGVIYKPDEGNEVISFVNSIDTYHGGSHANHVIDNIIKILINDHIKKKDKEIKISPQLLKENLVFFINSTIVNPSFSSQTKDTLTSKVEKFGSKYIPQEAFLKKLAKCGIVNQVMDLVKFKESSSLKKTDGKKQIRLRGIPKLDDANKAGTKDSNKCSLILTEGDSAKAFAIAGLSVVGRDYFGVFPLKGKLLNVREATATQLLNNEEINNIKQIMGLKHGEDYSDSTKFNQLRYGRIIILTDQDSVTGDTPLLLKNNNNLLEIKTIDDISNSEWISYNNKEENTSNYQIWTEQGWTTIKRVIRHKVNKKIYRVLTHTGVVDVTEDHSLIKENNEEISPKEIKVDDTLLHSFPNFEQLNKMIISSYQDREKIPKENIFDNKLKAQEMYLLYSSLGYNVSIDIEDNNYILSTNNHDNPNKIKKIIDLGNTEQYVYDLETDNHHFQAGIGRLIVHNTDGSHIKGLFMNFIHSIWPSLICRPNFITSLATPIVKAFKGNDVLKFYTLTDYQNWVDNNNTNSWKIKYYKGLGTSTSIEAREYFHEIETKLISYDWIDEKQDNEAILLAFEKSRADERKLWLQQYNKNNILEYSNKNVQYYDFIHKDLIHFSNDDLSRSIPSIVDGFKPSQRKIMYGAILRGLHKDEVKVAQLAGFVSDRAAYHHGEASLMGAIIGMAQDFVGSNNINILKPLGQFGTREKGGKDAASPRYIWTKFEDLTEIIFNNNDIAILNKQFEDNDPIEPEYYAPIIPMILINGAEGIGTGFSTKIAPYNPKEIINNLRKKINGKKMQLLNPWWANYDGQVKKIDDNNYELYGVWSIHGNKVNITELPIGEWTSNYKEHLEKMLETDTKKKFLGYTNNSTDTKVNFELEFSSDYEWNNLEKDFKLVKKYSITNMHLFDKNGTIKKYNTMLDIIDEYYLVRLELYQKRKDYQLEVLNNQLAMLSYKVKFILLIIEKKLDINNKKRIDIENKLAEFKFPKESYGYLLAMPIYSLTKEKIDELKKEQQDKQTEYDDLLNTSINDLWLNELNILEEEYDKWVSSKVQPKTKKTKKQKTINI